MVFGRVKFYTLNINLKTISVFLGTSIGVRLIFFRNTSAVAQVVITFIS